MGFTNEFLKIPWPSGMLERRYLAKIGQNMIKRLFLVLDGYPKNSNNKPIYLLLICALFCPCSSFALCYVKNMRVNLSKMSLWTFNFIPLYI